ncbi:hypothetical protein ACOSQ4_013221 [Xanthoceras sorbifolium]
MVLRATCTLALDSVTSAWSQSASIWRGSTILLALWRQRLVEKLVCTKLALGRQQLILKTSKHPSRAMAHQCGAMAPAIGSKTSNVVPP